MIQKFKDLPTNLQTFLASHTEDQYLSLKTMYDMILKGLNSNDPRTQTIASNLDLLEQTSKLYLVDMFERSSSSFFDQSEFTNKAEFVLRREIGISNATMAHELGHALFYLIDNRQLPEEFDQMMALCQQRLKQNPKKVEEFLQKARDAKEKLYRECIEQTNEYMEMHEKEFDKQASEFMLDPLKLQMQILKVAQGRNSGKEENASVEAAKIMASSPDEICEYIKKGFGNDYFQEEFFYRSDMELQTTETVTGILSAIYGKENPYYQTYYDSGFLRSHTPGYYERKETDSFDEQFADFVKLKFYGPTEAIPILTSLIGTEWFTMMEKKYQEIATLMKERKALYEYQPSSQSIDDILMASYKNMFPEEEKKR